MFDKVGQLFGRIAATLWGQFESRDEVQKFVFMAAIFGLIIGTYWALRPIKDSVFGAVVGPMHLWKAKIVSLCVISPLIIVYGKLVDMFERHKVFYGLVGIYALLTLGFAWGFMHPTIGLMNKTPDASRWIGWAFYVFVESFGSLVVALFWAFATDTTVPEAAKRGFPLVAMCGQIGNIFGPGVLNTQTLGFATSAPVIGICGLMMIALVVLFWVFMSVTPKEQLTGYQAEGAHKKEKGEEPGFFEGLKLLVTEGYLLGIFLIITLYEIIVTVIDYHFKQSVLEKFVGYEGLASAYLSSYGMWVGIIAFFCVLLGINNIQRKLGMTASLMTLPLLVGCAITMLWLHPSALNVAFWIMVFSKAVNYALNQPTLKQLYIPTTPDTKYKAQAWIEMFGSRGSKATASVYNGFRNTLGVAAFMMTTLLVSGGLITAWLFIAMYVAKKYNRAIENNEVVC